MLQVESVLPQKLLQNQNTKSKQSKYIIISLDFALFHFIMLFLGNDREVPSFITQLSDLNLEDHLGDTTAAHVVSVFPLPVTHITVSHKSESTCDRTREEAGKHIQKRTKGREQVQKHLLVFILCHLEHLHGIRGTGEGHLLIISTYTHT